MKALDDDDDDDDGDVSWVQEIAKSLIVQQLENEGKGELDSKGEG